MLLLMHSMFATTVSCLAKYYELYNITTITTELAKNGHCI